MMSAFVVVDTAPSSARSWGLLFWLQIWHAVCHMPITPLHFGPGLAIHSASPRKISFLSFASANVVIDLEPAYYIFTQQDPLHRFVHSYAGATLAIALTIALAMLTLHLAALVRLPNLFSWRQLTTRQLVIGALWGGYSHIVLDSFMHADMQPFAPLSSSNALHGLISIEMLHLGCIASGAAGLGVLMVRSVRAAREMREKRRLEAAKG